MKRGQKTKGGLTRKERQAEARLDRRPPMTIDQAREREALLRAALGIKHRPGLGP